jgi:hypothetical protein
MQESRNIGVGPISLTIGRSVNRTNFNTMVKKGL